MVDFYTQGPQGTPGRFNEGHGKIRGEREERERRKGGKEGEGEGRRKKKRERHQHSLCHGWIQLLLSNPTEFPGLQGHQRVAIWVPPIIEHKTVTDGKYIKSHQ